MPDLHKISYVILSMNGYYKATPVMLGVQNSLKIKTLNCKKIVALRKKLTAYLNSGPQNSVKTSVAINVIKIVFPSVIINTQQHQKISQPFRKFNHEM